MFNSVVCVKRVSTFLSHIHKRRSTKGGLPLLLYVILCGRLFFVPTLSGGKSNCFAET